MAEAQTLKFQKFAPAKAEQVHVGKVDESEARSRQPYVVMLINMTDRCMALGKINNGNWFAIPTVCRTCSSGDPNWCYDNQKYSPVMTCNCSDAPFNLSLSTQPDAQGNGWGATWVITPDCKYAGGVIALQ